VASADELGRAGCGCMTSVGVFGLYHLHVTVFPAYCRWCCSGWIVVEVVTLASMLMQTLPCAFTRCICTVSHHLRDLLLVAPYQVSVTFSIRPTVYLRSVASCCCRYPLRFLWLISMPPVTRSARRRMDAESRFAEASSVGRRNADLLPEPSHERLFASPEEDAALRPLYWEQFMRLYELGTEEGLLTNAPKGVRVGMRFYKTQREFWAGGYCR